MNALEFVTAIKREVIDNGMQGYENTLGNETAATDPLWIATRKLYSSLSSSDQSTLLQFVRLVQVDTLSHIFGILDGSSYLNEKRESFQLISEVDGETLNGDLQDILLEMEE
ncbi:hypothetical protein [Chitinophaga caseinilytica]|uniref:hypothetical protein n=1 Tax=Chitinophaga caseinilytica TaxID=2267521 RepID=UPI003C2B2B42